MAEQSQDSKSAKESNHAVYDPGLRIEVKNLTLKDRRLVRGVYQDKTCDLARVLDGAVSNHQPAVGVGHEDERCLNSSIG